MTVRHRKSRAKQSLHLERADAALANDPAWVLGEVIEERVFRDVDYQYVAYGVPVPLTAVVEDVLAEQELVELHPNGAVTVTDKGRAWHKAAIGKGAVAA